jgi:hypothetical protein
MRRIGQKWWSYGGKVSVWHGERDDGEKMKGLLMRVAEEGAATVWRQLLLISPRPRRPHIQQRGGSPG